MNLVQHKKIAISYRMLYTTRMVFVRTLALIILFLVALCNLFTSSWFFLIGLLVIGLVYYISSNFIKKWNTSWVYIVIFIILSLIPFPRNAHPYSSEMAEYYEPAALGFGYPAALVKMYPHCDMVSLSSMVSSTDVYDPAFSLQNARNEQITSRITPSSTHEKENKKDYGDCPSGGNIASGWLFFINVAVFVSLLSLFTVSSPSQASKKKS